MECIRCQFNNPGGMKFCGECGRPLTIPCLICPSCGFENHPQFKFCADCGIDLTGQDLERVHPPVSQGPEAERRQLTVMFCDLVGSTKLSEQLDPEELREVVRDYQIKSEYAISRFGGHIAQYLGDGLLVYFGYPRAHEDDAQRAVRSGLGIIDEMGKLNERLQKERNISLSVRIGIHTGLVVVGEMGGGEKTEHLALGDTPNIAARVQGLAEPDTVLMSAATEQLARGFFVCQSIGAHSLKGVSQPMELYQIMEEVGVYGSFDIAVTKGLTPFVGRESEVQKLVKCWELTKKKIGQVALIAGEAGIGKSRLIQVFSNQISQESHIWMVCHCSSYYQNSAFYPIIDLLKRRLEFDPNESSAQKLAKLEDGVNRIGLDPNEAIPLFAPLLSLPVPENYPPLDMTSQMQKEKTLTAILGWLLKLSEDDPLVFIIENLQWSDPSTLEALRMLMDQAKKARILILLAYRPDMNVPWNTGSKLSEIILNRLSTEEINNLAERVAGGKSLPNEFLDQVVIKTDGVPLFIEELTKMVLDSGFITEESGSYKLSMPLSDLTIPVTLQDSLMARLDQLGSVKEVIQLAATLGLEFSYDLIKAVSPMKNRDLGKELDKLVDAELLRRRDIQSEIRYSFNQELIQDAAYRSLLRKTRQKYHQEIARTIEKHFTEIRKTHPEILAHHLTEAGIKEEAISYWLEAGKIASRQSANLEGINHLTRGLDLIQALPEDPERNRLELSLQVALGPPMTATKGFASNEVEGIYARASELCSQIGETPQLFPVLRGLWLFHMVRAELTTAIELGHQLLKLGEKANETGLQLQGHVSLGLTNFYLGNFEAALKHLEHVIRQYDQKEHHPMAYIYGEDPGVVSLSYTTLTLWMLGRYDEAVQRDHEVLTLANKLSHPFSQALAYNFSARFHQCRGDAQSAKKMAEASIDMSAERGFKHWISTGNIFKGWAMTREGNSEDGLTLIHEGLSAWQGSGAVVFGLHCQAILAEAYMQNGQLEAGIDVIKIALADSENNDERLYLPEIYRIKGELLLAQSDDNMSEAEECFRKALNTSITQKAKPLELSAAKNLNRLLTKQGRVLEAQEMVK